MPPASFVVRDARPDDVPALARLHVATFVETHGGTHPPTVALRERQRRGLGRLLVVETARRFLARGVDSMLLSGDARSPSNGFYERLGAGRLLSDAGEFHGGYGWRDLRRLVGLAPGG